VVASALASPIRAGAPLAEAEFREARRAALLDFCKWDPQVGDVATLVPFPLLIEPQTWRQLSDWAEALAAEMLAAEAELLARPELHRALGIPRALRCALRRALREGATPAAARIARFDFHWTRDGWRISEVNSDVPGGYCEASAFTELVARCVPGSRSSGDPGCAWADAIAAAAPRCVALVSAPGFMEDTQVVAYLADRLRERGRAAFAAKPENLRWVGGRAELDAAWRAGPLDAVVRFFQAEWLPRVTRACQPLRFVAGGHTPVTNPGTALLSESKRFPTVWSRLATPLPTWRRLLPETRDPREAPWRRDEGWVLKSAFCNNGDDLAIPGESGVREWRQAARAALLAPGRWIAQRRFASVPLATPAGPVHPCLGVYVVNGHAAGIYGRLAAKPLIDFQARDVAVLVQGSERAA
jgi:glutathionylspermidine synthase